MSDKEVFKDIPNYEGLYQVSNKGNVKSIISNNKILKPKITSKGYLSVKLYKGGQKKDFLAHRLVAEAFIPNPQSLYTVNHKNEIKTDNRVENLEWMSIYDNNRYGTHDERMAKSLCLPILQYDLNGNFIKEWDSIKSVEEEKGFRNSHISECCSGKQKTSYGYVWKYKL